VHGQAAAGAYTLAQEVIDEADCMTRRQARLGKGPAHLSRPPARSFLRSCNGCRSSILPGAPAARPPLPAAYAASASACIGRAFRSLRSSDVGGPSLPCSAQWSGSILQKSTHPARRSRTAGL